MIARALMHAPRVLFLDEPTTGLDPAARLFVWDRLRELRDSDVTLVLTTHDMDEAALLADRVGIMDHGHLLALDTPEALMRSLEGEGTLELAADGPADGAVVAALAALDGRRPRRAGPRRHRERRARTRRRPRREPLRVRLYLTGDAALLVAPAAGRARRARPRAPGREARRRHAGGRLHPPHGTDAPVSAVAAPATPAGDAVARLPRRSLPRPLRHLARVPGLPRAGDPAAAVPAVRVREGARAPSTTRSTATRTCSFPACSR